jgi:hypothetical protein
MLRRRYLLASKFVINEPRRIGTMYHVLVVVTSSSRYAPHCRLEGHFNFFVLHVRLDLFNPAVSPRRMVNAKRIHGSPTNTTIGLTSYSISIAVSGHYHTTPKYLGRRRKASEMGVAVLSRCNPSPHMHIPRTPRALGNIHPCHASAMGQFPTL